MAFINSLLAMGMGAANFFSNNKKKRRMQRAIDNYERQDLNNVYENMQISTAGANLAQENAMLATGTSVDALRQSGSRAAIGGVGDVQRNNYNLNRQTQVDLDRQQKEIDRLYAQDESRIRDMQESREANELAGMGQALNTYRRDANTGAMTAINALSGLGDMGLNALQNKNMSRVNNNAMNVQDSYNTQRMAQSNMSGYDLNQTPTLGGMFTTGSY